MKSEIGKSKLLSRWLRHRPDAIGLELDKSGWANVEELVLKAVEAGISLSHEEVRLIVKENDKQRFTLSADGRRIRAAQGHSISVELQLPIKTPPPLLYHGTVPKFLQSIQKKGLLPGNRRDVHLSADISTAELVGSRRGTAVVLKIETYPLLRDGYHFSQADNGVWLTKEIPSRYITFPALIKLQ